MGSSLYYLVSSRDNVHQHLMLQTPVTTSDFVRRMIYIYLKMYYKVDS